MRALLLVGVVVLAGAAHAQDAGCSDVLPDGRCRRDPQPLPDVEPREEPEDTVLGLAWGSSVTQVRAAKPVVNTTGELQWSGALGGGQRVLATFFFADERLAGVQVEFIGTEFEDLVALFTDKYGYPSMRDLPGQARWERTTKMPWTSIALDRAPRPVRALFLSVRHANGAVAKKIEAHRALKMKGL